MGRDYIDDPAEDSAFSLRRMVDRLDSAQDEAVSMVEVLEEIRAQLTRIANALEAHAIPLTDEPHGD